jgi:monoterpene epsilon-lactone hydrolase
MASWQAYLASWLLRRRLKPKLRASRDLLESRKLLTPPPYRVPSDMRITPAVMGNIAGEWVEASVSGDLTLLYLHGGGYFACSPETHRPVTAAFAQEGFRVYAPDYRRAPEAHFPSPVEDALAAYRGLRAAGVAAARMVVAGDSAGGGLALALLVTLRDAKEPLPAAAALFSPWTDLAGTGASLHTNSRRCSLFDGRGIVAAALPYLNGADPRHPLASPLYADPAGLPPLLIHVGTNETLLDDSVRLADRARAAGVTVELKIWPVVPHAWQLAQSNMPEARKSVREAAAFLRAAAARTAAAQTT